MNGTLYSTDELARSAAVLVALGSAEALQIVQHLQKNMLAYLADHTVSEIAEATGLDISTADHLLSILVRAEVLIVETPDNYRLNPNMPDLAQDIILSLWPL